MSFSFEIKKKDFGIIFWIHLVLIVLAVFSPLYIDYKLIILVNVLLWLQYYILGNCFLTKKEFNTRDEDMTFWFYYLSKVFYSLDKKKTKFFVRVILPFLIMMIAIYLQTNMF